MKKASIVFLLLTVLIVISAAAQDFESAKLQFISFNFCVPVGYDLGAEEIIAGYNFGFAIPVAEKMEIGFDKTVISARAFNLFRISFDFTEKFGAALSVGAETGITPAAAVSLGFYANLMQARAASGIAYKLGLRADFMTNTDAFDEGVILIGLCMGFGL